MPLSSGTRLGPYEIVASIGKGGMGEVYRARDGRLNRDVAVKVSAAQFSERFEREARAIAALNHPNICHLYDVGPNYLVMELVEGSTLAERIAGKALTEAEALQFASQIAQALEAAHEKGIVHRDLKPANIKIREDGTVKVLDFGLAKVGVFPAAPPSEDSPTVSMEGTQAGVVLGTAAYMSPEQAKGQPVDKRADIWSFGVVVYEMLAGRRLFKGAGTTDTLAAVIEREPDWSRVPPKALPLLRRCLEKDPKRRLRDIGDAMPLLDFASEPLPDRRGMPRLLPWILAVAALTAMAGSFFYLRERTSAIPPAQVRFRISLPENQRLGRFALSPDGSQLAFIATGSDMVPHLWIRRMDSLESRMLPETEGAGGMPFWSFDSRFVVFATDQKLKKIDSSGGSPQRLCDLGADLYGGAWSPDNVILVGTSNGVERVSGNGGDLSLAAESQLKGGSGTPVFLPDGRHFLYFNGSSDLARRGVWVGSLDTNPREQQRNRLIATPDTFAYTPSPNGDGRVFFLRAGSLVMQVFNERKLELTGEPVPIVDRVAEDNGSSFFTVAPTGALVYVPGTAGDISRLTWYNAGGKVLDTVGDPGVYTSSLLSPDGKFDLVTAGGDVSIVDLNRGVSTRLTTSRSVVGAAIWSTEGHVAYTENSGGVSAIYQRAANGAGGEELLWKATFAGILGTNHATPDGHFLLFGTTSAKTSFDTWALPLQGDRTPFPYLGSEFGEIGARFSPDGKWVAYRSDKSGKNEIYVRSFDPARRDGSPYGEETLVSKGGAAGMPRWRKDQKELYYLAQSGNIMAVEVSPGAVFRKEPTLLFQTPPGFIRGNAPGSLADVDADGKKFLLAMPVAHSSADDGLTVVLNWLASVGK